ncbi:alpha/beta hydrolase [Actinomadura citrea]|uniref:Acetyl esterase/lipase n=1 Tax=Actinomadura citrea TaxID=46158 RepID=A0A7Y9G8C0_9ACTN|nr:alpha/beta hydrolase [Actinomadura citrea]NYE11824.1 acetyl esterase/lipase [Actinomadura citrea]GGT91079.1 esterase [Actinomadura citrea]
MPLDAELAAALDGMPYVGLADPVRARAAMNDLVRALARPVGDERVVVEDRILPGSVPVRIYRPRATPAPVLVYFHGGGFVTGGLENEHERCLEFAGEDGIAVVSVDYRLAPEHPFPAGFDDCHAATVWAWEHAGEFGGDPERVAVGGGSAGGALAAAVALRARDEGGPPLVFQMLLYPVLDDRMATPSMRTFTEPPLFNSGDVRHMWRHYLGGRTDVPAYAAPARAEDLSGLPRAYVLVPEHDPLRDEGLAYAHRLIVSGVPTELHHVPGACHGFDGIMSARLGRLAFEEERAVLRRCLSGRVDTPIAK